jgi:hypothetical protein
MEIQKELNTYYQNLMFEGKEYLNKIQTLPLKSNNAIDIAKSLDRIEYNAKVYLQTYRKKRVLTSEEKQHHEFNTPIDYILKYFHTKRNFMPISEELGKLINRIKEIQKGRNNEKDI